MGARRLVTVLLAVLGLFAFSLPASSASPGRKVVGVIFDDSGSMEKRIQLPAFAAQLLVSTLNPTRDRLFTIRLSDYEADLGALGQRGDPLYARIAGEGVNPKTMAALREKRFAELPKDEFGSGRPLQALVGSIRDRWALPPTSNTPFGPVELMLSTLADETGPDDQAYLLILTDGEFDPVPPPIAVIRKDLAVLQARFKGPLDVSFVLIAPDDEGGEEARREVERQGVRRALTGMFNGTEDKPFYQVRNSKNLVEAMFDVVARINSTARSAVPGRGAVVDVVDRGHQLGSFAGDLL